MKTPLAAFFALAVLATLVISNAAGQMPRTLNYQGTLAMAPQLSLMETTT